MPRIRSFTYPGVAIGIFLATADLERARFLLVGERSFGARSILLAKYCVRFGVQRLRAIQNICVVNSFLDAHCSPPRVYKDGF